VSPLLEVLNHLASLWIAEGRAGTLRQVLLDSAGLRITLDLDTAWAKGEAVLRAEVTQGADGRTAVTVTLEKSPAVLNRALVPFREIVEQGRVVFDFLPPPTV
jgi:hypothetical protein